MKIIKTIREMKETVESLKKEGFTVGYVPTMGSLHEGHESLMNKARTNNDKVVVSIFVNPTQFGPDEDFDNYPRNLKRDAEICEKNNVDYIFHPEVEEMYPTGFNTFVEPSEKMTNILCGKSRPIHFRGVCTVLIKLFSIIKADNAYFGEKDIQQVAIVKKLVRDFNLDINIVSCPIIREEDGLAKSSRNIYLNEEERKAAVVLSKSLNYAKNEIKKGSKDAKKIKEDIIKIIEETKIAKIDYIEILDFKTFDFVDKIDENSFIAMAVYFGKARLIDNMIVKNI